MKYYFIYSAGGGAGDWNGVKRVWKDDMPERLKKNILLKFGDIYFNHKSSRSILRAGRWKEIKNIREWLYDDLKDEYVREKANILLDSGTAKIVNFIDHNYNLGKLNTEEIIQHFRNIIEENNIIEKYANVIIESNINLAVTLDVPDPFKVRSDNNIVDRRRNVLESNKTIELMDVSIEYTNKLFHLLCDKIGEERTIHTLMPIVNGKWNKEEYERYLSKLSFIPKNIAIGGISNREVNVMKLDLSDFQLDQYQRVHFLGCGGINKVQDFKIILKNSDKFSVDVSTPINRSIDGAKSGTAFSGIYSYNDFGLTRITPQNKDKIMEDYKKSSIHKIFEDKELEDILNSILEHQNGMSSEETFNNRARLIFLNSDIFRYNAEL